MTPLLEIAGVTKAFGGLAALDGLDLHVGEGEIVSAIGPNGAGKSTLFNVITGLYAPDAGDIKLRGDSIVGRAPHQITKLGIGRTFQNVHLFANMTVLENAMVGQHSRSKTGVFGAIFHLPGTKAEEEQIREQAKDALGFFGTRLSGYRQDQPAFVLSYANRRRLEMARAIATEPSLLLLDEPTAGMNPSETLELRDNIRRMRDEQRTPVLELRDVSSHYGLVSVLRDVTMEIYPGEMVCLLGGNASGKTTTLKTILGYVTPTTGEVAVDGEVVSGMPTVEVVRRGVSMVPENRRLFPNMTVDENLELGAYQQTDKAKIAEDRDRVLELFPRVRERLKQKAGTLSGGEQQMVAMGRALMADPKVLLMDEPSMGLSPVLVDQVFEIIKSIRALGRTVFVVEQNANMALSIADRGYVIQTGQVVLADTAENLLANPLMREAYLGEL